MACVKFVGDCKSTFSSGPHFSIFKVCVSTSVYRETNQKKNFLLTFARDSILIPDSDYNLGKRWKLKCISHLNFQVLVASAITKLLRFIDPQFKQSWTGNKILAVLNAIIMATISYFPPYLKFFKIFNISWKMSLNIKKKKSITIINSFLFRHNLSITISKICHF